MTKKPKKKGKSKIIKNNKIIIIMTFIKEKEANIVYKKKKAFGEGWEENRILNGARHRQLFNCGNGL